MKRCFAALMACLLLTGCSGGVISSPDGPTQVIPAGGEDLRELDVVLDWYPNALHAFLYVAMERGYYAEEGLKVNIRFPSNANDAISLVAAGKADVGLYYQQDVIQARANQAVPVKSIGAVVQGPLNIVLSLAEKGIRSPGDLAGKTVGYAGTELSEAIVRSVMAGAGADYGDVTMVDVGFDLMSSMTTGSVDATIGCLSWRRRDSPSGGWNWTITAYPPTTRGCSWQTTGPLRRTAGRWGPFCGPARRGSRI